MKRTFLRSLMIYLAGILVLAFFAIMALAEADQRGRSMQLTMTVINLTITQASKFYMQTSAAATIPLISIRTLTPSPTVRK